MRTTPLFTPLHIIPIFFIKFFNITVVYYLQRNFFINYNPIEYKHPRKIKWNIKARNQNVNPFVRSIAIRDPWDEYVLFIFLSAFFIVIFGLFNNRDCAIDIGIDIF